jgi:hypothetical protein
LTGTRGDIEATAARRLWGLIGGTQGRREFAAFKGGEHLNPCDEARFFRASGLDAPATDVRYAESGLSQQERFGGMFSIYEAHQRFAESFDL